MYVADGVIVRVFLPLHVYIDIVRFLGMCVRRILFCIEEEGKYRVSRVRKKNPFKGFGRWIGGKHFVGWFS